MHIAIHSKKILKPFQWTSIILVVAITGEILWLKNRPSAEDRLDAIEAARRIPDELNAALLYAQIKDLSPDANLPKDQNDIDLEHKLSTQPWRSIEYPEESAQLKSKQYITEALHQAGQLDQCVFPLPRSVGDMIDMSDVSCIFSRWKDFLQMGHAMTLRKVYRVLSFVRLTSFQGWQDMHAKNPRWQHPWQILTYSMQNYT